MTLLRNGILPGLLLLLPIQTWAADDISCKDFAHQVITDMVAVFHDSTLSNSQKESRTRAIFNSSVDSDWLGKAVLGKYWQQATSNERSTYLQLYSDYIAYKYVRKFNGEDGFGVEDMKIISIESTKEAHWLVKSLLINPGQDDMRVDYITLQGQTGCKVHDIRIEGVSMYASQRSEFQTLASFAGIAGVISALQAQTAQYAQEALN